MPFLTAGGHRVLPLVRSREEARLEPGLKSKVEPLLQIPERKLAELTPK